MFLALHDWSQTGGYSVPAYDLKWMGLGARSKLNIIYMTSFFLLLLRQRQIKASAVVLQYRCAFSLHGSVCICLCGMQAAMKSSITKCQQSTVAKWQPWKPPREHWALSFLRNALFVKLAHPLLQIDPHHPPTLFKTSRGEGLVVLGKVELQWEAKAECWTGLLKVQDLGRLLVNPKGNVAETYERTVH